MTTKEENQNRHEAEVKKSSQKTRYIADQKNEVRSDTKNNGKKKPKNERDSEQEGIFDQEAIEQTKIENRLQGA